MNNIHRLILLILILTAACSPQTPLPQPAPNSSATPFIDAAPSTAETLTAATPTHTPGGPLTLRIWLPPQFDPSMDTPAGKLMRQRLLEFAQQRPRVMMDVRVKAESGPGGMLDALTTASAAAPTALPDLVALPRDTLEVAALKGLLYPYRLANLTIDEKSWFPFASDLAHLQENVYGLPFAGDALAQVYRSDLVPRAPTQWSQVISSTQKTVFPAGDPGALYTLTLYQSQGGKVHDDQGRPVIETVALTEVLTYFAKAQITGVMNADLAQFQSDDQAWAAFQGEQAPIVTVWCSHYLASAAAVADEKIMLAPLPTATGVPYTLATGWVWALSSREAEHQRVAIELANFLTESGFLAEWTEAAGYIPPYPAALDGWKNASSRQVVEQIARSAHAMPPADILAALSTPLWQATNDVLKGQNDPSAAAQEAAASLTAP